MLVLHTLFLILLSVNQGDTVLSKLLEPSRSVSKLNTYSADITVAVFSIINSPPGSRTVISPNTYVSGPGNIWVPLTINSKLNSKSDTFGRSFLKINVIESSISGLLFV